MLEKELSKTENKYTLKTKTCGTAMADDGYKWRKYGQKFIKNSPNPRYVLIPLYNQLLPPFLFGFNITLWHKY